MLVEHLPGESATARALDGEHAGWSQELELLALVYDRLSQQVWQAGGKSSAPKPQPFPRPGSKRTHRTGLTSDQIASRLVEQRCREQRRRGD